MAKGRDGSAAGPVIGRFDVAVVGSGPSGALCAFELARAGHRVAVLDRFPPPRYKTCGGGLIRRARDTVGIDLGPVVEQDCPGASLHFVESGIAFHVDRDEPLVSMTMRADLDRRLLNAAQDAGAELLAPCGLTDLGPVNGSIELRTSSGRIEAAYAVAADGALGPTAGAAGWGRHTHSIPALESEIRVDDRTLERFSSRARFDLDLVTPGYAWVFPKREHLSVGCLSTRPGARGLRAALERYLQQVGLDRYTHREDHGFVIPTRPRDTVLARDRVFLTGDAAGLADPVTCEGITHAIVSGRLAGQAIAGAFDQPEKAYREYQSGLQRKVLSELRVARRLSTLLYDLRRFRTAVFRRAGPPLCEAVADVIVGRCSYTSLVYRPLSYFKLLRELMGRREEREEESGLPSGR